jgi:hypothetical protein
LTIAKDIEIITNTINNPKIDDLNPLLFLSTSKIIYAYKPISTIKDNTKLIVDILGINNNGYNSANKII